MKITRSQSQFTPVSFTCETPDELRVMLALLGQPDAYDNDIVRHMSREEFELIHEGLIAATDWDLLAATVGYINGTN